MLAGAATFAEAFGGGEWGRLLGWWHDIGKYSDRFQNYLRVGSQTDEDEHQADVGGRVDHSTAGAQLAARHGQAGLLLAYCIAGHHAGIPDDVGSESSLSLRLKKTVDSYVSAPASLLNRTLPGLPRLRPPRDLRGAAFSLAFFTRMLFSCLVDADFLATEWFMNPQRAGARPRSQATPAQLLAELAKYLEGKRRDDTEVNRRRHEVLCACRAKAELPPGVFSLEVPTGGGKTLSSLAFGLTHAALHHLHRVIYAIPFTSIIEQTADVFRAALGELADNLIEHHSSLEPDDPARQSICSRLAAENFDAPLVVTTNVQLFESLFASRSSACRKLHRLARSVIILDEAQTLPPRLLSPTLAALDELVRNYDCTVLLCTATQPALEYRKNFPIGLNKPIAVIEEPLTLHNALKRTHVELTGTLENDEVVDRLRHERQSLCIVNSRHHASDLFTALQSQDALHLSANMCAAHRADTIAEIRQCLAEKKPCTVISTQVIEAGVDLDFPVVFRAAAGLDSIAQAAGRCNREGCLTDEADRPVCGRVFIFDYETTTYPSDPMIERAAAIFREVAPDHCSDILSPDAIHAYFKLRYWNQGGDDGRGWDRGRGGQSVMDCFAWEPESGLHAQFRSAAERYRLIDDGQTPILVPYGEKGRSLIAELAAMPEKPDPKWLRGFDRRAQRYIVGVHERALKTLLDRGVLLERHGRHYLANETAYHNRLGVSFEAAGLDANLLVQ